MKPTLPEPDIILAFDRNTYMWAESYTKIGAECFHADTVQRLIDEAYDAALEDAAKVCDSRKLVMSMCASSDECRAHNRAVGVCASAIRALKGEL